jgi:hypothetical protein
VKNIEEALKEEKMMMIEMSEKKGLLNIDISANSNPKDEELEEISRTYQHKKANKKQVYPKVFDFLCISCCWDSCKKYKRQRYNLLEKCIDIADKYTQINFITKKLFEIEYIKSLILTEKEKKLMKFQFKYINFKNYDDSMNFLDGILHEKVNVDTQLLHKGEEDSEPNKNKLLDGLKKYYNF